MVKKLIILIFFAWIFYICPGFLNWAGAATQQNINRVNLTVFGDCGNGSIDPGEECDDNNFVSGDGCSETCITEFCGDTIVNNNGEVCDGGNQACSVGGYDGVQNCNASCDGWGACVPSESCGDGIVNGPETCDDGNNDDCDVCHSDCTRFDNICGDNIKECAEECDGDIGVSDGYVCTQTCSLEKMLSGSVFLYPLVGLNIINIYPRLGSHEIVLSWQTNKSAVCDVRWGETNELEKERIILAEKSDSHRARLSDLRPETDYYYEIVCSDSWGKQMQTPVYVLKTKAEADVVPPTNPANFRVIYEKKQAEFFWNNPLEADFQGVKIIRNIDHYPQFIADGTVIYNGKAEKAADPAVEAGKIYYYSIFSYDGLGNYSSGAIASLSVPAEQGDSLLAKDEEKDREIIVNNLEDVPRQGGKETSEQEREESKKYSIDVEIRLFNGSIEPELIDGAYHFLPGTVIDLQASVGQNIIADSDNLIIKLKSSGKSGDWFASYLFHSGEKSGKLNAIFYAPQAPGTYLAGIFLLREGIEYQIASAELRLVIESFGQIIDDNSKTPLEDAGVELFSEENGVVKKWPAQIYRQDNPAYSNSAGFYGFIVPDGKYSARIFKKGYEDLVIDLVEIKNNIFNQSAGLIKSRSLTNRIIWRLLILLLIVLLIIFWLHRRFAGKKPKTL